MRAQIVKNVFSLGIMTIFTINISYAIAENTNPIAVTLSQIKYEKRQTKIRTSGRVSNKNEVHLSFKTDGLIENILVEEGDLVQSGQMLASLDLEEIDAKQQKAISKFNKAADDLTRFNNLYDKKLISLQHKQDAQSTYDTAAAELQIANFNHKLSVIRAPTNGRILKRYAESSELIKSGQNIFLLASQEHGSVVRLGLIDQDIVKIAVGDLSLIALDAYPGREFTGYVTEVAMSTSSKAGTFEVEILIQDEGVLLRAGLIARVDIYPSQMEFQFFIPMESVFKAVDGKATVFILDESKNTVSEISVNIIDILRDEVVVSGKLKVTDKVIKRGTPYLSDGSVVSVIGSN